MAALDFPTATAAGQTFEADTGVIYVYVGTPPNGFWSANATVSGQAALDARYVQVAGDSMTGALNIAGNVGIGTTSPTTKVEVVDTVQATANNDYTLAIRGDDSGTDGESAQIFLGAINATTRGTVIAAERQSTSNNHDLIFKTSAASAAPTERLRIDSSGNVGIGTSSPDQLLDIAANTDATVQLKSTKTGVGVNDVLGTIAYYGSDGSGSGAGIKSSITSTAQGTGGAGSDLRFHTTNSAGSNNTEKVRIDEQGRVGVGTTSPSHLFTVSNSSGGTLANITNTIDADFQVTCTSGVSTIGASVGQLAFKTSNTERVRIDSSGKVQIGRTSPLLSTELTVGGDNGLTVAKANGSRIGMFGSFNQDLLIIGTYDNYPVVFRQNNNERMRIDSSGNVGIGTTSPISELHVENSGGNCGVRVISGTSGVSYLNLGDTADNNIGSIEYDNSVNALKIISNNYERMHIDSSGNVQIRENSNTVSTGASLYLYDLAGSANSANSSGRIAFYSSDNTDGASIRAEIANYYENSSADSALTFKTYNGSLSERMRIDSAGRVGINLSNPGDYSGVARDLVVGNHSGAHGITIAAENNNTGYLSWADGTSTVAEQRAGRIAYSHADSSMRFDTAASERMRIDSSGRLLRGTSSARTNFYNAGTNSAYLLNEGTNYQTATIASICNSTTHGPYIILARSRGASTGSNDIVQNGDTLGIIDFNGADGSRLRQGGRIHCVVDSTPGVGDMPGRLVFSTTADGASSPTERMRIDSSGNVNIGKNSSSFGVAGSTFYGVGVAEFVVNGGTVTNFNRLTNDGRIIGFYQNSLLEGEITVSGSTVSYNGAHLTRWSQLPGNAIRVAIYRGTVLSNLDEMCEWGDEDNEQLNRMKISDVEGDRNVSGVFQGWDEDDEEYTDDLYCAMTGDFVIRIGKDVTVERGDLLMSAGDGTAKPQEDDIIRSKTIAKVTSTHVSETYADGSYCVPCVLMAC